MSEPSIRSNTTWNVSRISQENKIQFYGKKASNNLTYDFVYLWTGNGVNVYVVDTGINFHHEEFSGRTPRGYSPIVGEDYSRDDNGHGTHVGSLIVGKTFGIAPGANVISVKVLKTGELQADANDVVSALKWVYTDATTSSNPSVVSLSIATDDHEVKKIILRLLRANIHVVISAGNKGVDIEDTRLAEPIVVAASTIRDAVRDKSNYGTAVTVFAPGKHIWGAGIEGTTGRKCMSGTSAAAAQVTGVVTGVLSHDPSLTPSAMKEQLLSRWSVEGKLSGVPTNTVNKLVCNKAFLRNNYESSSKKNAALGEGAPVAESRARDDDDSSRTTSDGATRKRSLAPL